MGYSGCRTGNEREAKTKGGSEDRSQDEGRRTEQGDKSRVEGDERLQGKPSRMPMTPKMLLRKIFRPLMTRLRAKANQSKAIIKPRGGRCTGKKKNNCLITQFHQE